MSSRLAIASFLATVSFLPAVGMGNDLALQILAQADFDARLSLCTSLGKRADPSLGDVIAYLRSALPPRSVTESESLLTALLGGLLSPAWGRENVAGRFEANRTELDAILGRLATIRDPLLAALLVRTLLLVGDASRAPAVLRLADAYRERLSGSGGLLDPAGKQCVLALLSFAAALGGAEFLDPCLSLQQSSRDGEVIRSARSAAARIAARIEGTGDR